MTGLEGPSSSALFQYSFPQPDDLEVEDDQAPTNGHHGVPSATASNTPLALPVPRASEQRGNESGSDIDSFKPQNTRRASTMSFVTASSVPAPLPSDGNTGLAIEDHEQPSGLQVPNSDGEMNNKAREIRQPSNVESTIAGPASTVGEPPADAVSTTPLLRKADKDKNVLPDSMSSPKGILARMQRRSEPGASSSASSPLERVGDTLSRQTSTLRNLVKFDVPEDSKRASIHLRAKQAQMTVQRASTRLRRKKLQDGLVVKMERMLVRVDAAVNQVPDDLDENASQKIDSRVKDKWREYMVVCRHSESEGADFVLQMYKTRVSGFLTSS